MPRIFGGMSAREVLDEVRYLRENSAKLEKTMLERTKSWCQANGIEPHARLSSAATYMSAALMVAKRSMLPEGKSEAEVMHEAIFTLMKAANEADPVAVADAIKQISVSFIGEPEQL